MTKFWTAIVYTLAMIGGGAILILIGAVTAPRHQQQDYPRFDGACRDAAFSYEQCLFFRYGEDWREHVPKDEQ